MQEITEAVEARLLVKLISHRAETERSETNSQSAVVVRPVFGLPLSSETVDCDVFMMMPFADT